MNQEEAKNKVKEPFTEYGKYSYADYLTWKVDEMVELIKGRVFKSAAAAPKRIHQEISGRIFNKLYNFLEEHDCKVYEAPFDVRLPLKSKKNEDIDTVVQPDICLICDKSKLDELGCIGAPDLVIDILSSGDYKKELQNKYEVYEESGVKEYWIIHPDEQSVMTYLLSEGNTFPPNFSLQEILLNPKASPDSNLIWNMFSGI